MAHDVLMLVSGGLAGYLLGTIVTIYFMDRGMGVKLAYCAKHGTRLPWDDDLYTVKRESNTGIKAEEK